MPNFVPGEGAANAQLMKDKLLSRRIIQDGHWLWTGCWQTNGYGQLKFNGRDYIVHRVSAYVFLGFDLNSKLKVLHKQFCNNRKCFNPEHLYIGNQSDNTKDSIDLHTHYQISKTHCPQGHKYTEENTDHINGGRRCKACHREEYRRWKEKRNVNSLG